MNSEDVSCSAIDFLNEQGVEYMVVGSLAGNFYCVPRSTQDADIVVASSVGQVASKLSRAIPNLKFDPQLAFESVTATKKVLIRSALHDFQIELFELSNDPHDQERFTRRVWVEFIGRKAWIATAEDIIITKLRWAEYAGREKDIADLRNMIGVQHDSLDWSYIESWCDRHGTQALLDRLRSEAGMA